MDRFKFNGQQYDSVTQQYYLRARYYNPVIGRFTQEDTYNADGLNLYAYCRNNPVYYVDPSGNICDSAAQRIMDKFSMVKYSVSYSVIVGNDARISEKALQINFIKAKEEWTLPATAGMPPSSDSLDVNDTNPADVPGLFCK